MLKNLLKFFAFYLMFKLSLMLSYVVYEQLTGLQSYSHYYYYNFYLWRILQILKLLPAREDGKLRYQEPSLLLLVEPFVLNMPWRKKIFFKHLVKLTLLFRATNMTNNEFTGPNSSYYKWFTTSQRFCCYINKCNCSLALLILNSFLYYIIFFCE